MYISSNNICIAVSLFKTLSSSELPNMSSLILKCSREINENKCAHVASILVEVHQRLIASKL